MDSMEILQIEFQRAETDLQYVTHKLEAEYSQKCKGTEANPLILLQRLKKLEEELPILRAECELIVASKQDILELSQTLLTKNRMILQRLEQKVAQSFETNESQQLQTQFHELYFNWNKEVGVYMGMPQNNGQILSSQNLNIELLKIGNREGIQKAGSSHSLPEEETELPTSN